MLSPSAANDEQQHHQQHQELQQSPQQHYNQKPCRLDLEYSVTADDYDDYYEPFDTILDNLLYQQQLPTVKTPSYYATHPSNITQQSRYSLAKWLMVVGQENGLDDGEVLLALAFTDYVLCHYSINTDTDLYIVGGACLIVTVRLMHDSVTPALANNLQYFMCNALQINPMVMHQLTGNLTQYSLTYNLNNFVIPFYFLDLIINRLMVCQRHYRSYRSDTSFMLSAQKYINHAAMFPTFNRYSPSVVAAASILAALIESGYNECVIDTSIQVICQAIKETEDIVMSCHKQLTTSASSVYRFDGIAMTTNAAASQPLGS